MRRPVHGGQQLAGILPAGSGGAGTPRCWPRPSCRPTGSPGPATRRRTGSTSAAPKDAANSIATITGRYRSKTSTSTRCTGPTGTCSPGPPEPSRPLCRSHVHIASVTGFPNTYHRQAYGSPSDALGEAEVQAAGTQRETDAGMATRGPATVSRSVRALGAAIHDLRTGRHEPDEPRGSRPDLWGAAGEIPAAYPAKPS